MVEEILITIETEHMNERGIPFGWLYELYKFEIIAFGNVSIRAIEYMTTFYEDYDDHISAIGCSETLRDQYVEEDIDEKAKEAQKRVDKNIQMLREKDCFLGGRSVGSSNSPRRAIV